MKKIVNNNNNLKIKKIVGSTLCFLILSSAVIAIAGIWGGLTGEIVWQCLLTFGVVAGSSIALGAATEVYFK
jgi:hypothetical protein